MIIDSPSETKTTGYRVGRLRLIHEVRPLEEHQILLELGKFDLVIVDSVPENGGVVDLFRKAEWNLIPAGGIITWEGYINDIVDRTSFVPKSQLFSINDHRDNTLSEFLELSKLVFRNYTNHYSSSAELRNIRVENAYEDWIKHALMEPNVELIGANIHGRTASFALVRYLETSAEVLLAGTHPDYRGQGLYRELFLFLGKSCLVRKISRLNISTQIENIRVQRIWASLSLLPLSAFARYHAWSK